MICFFFQTEEPKANDNLAVSLLSPPPLYQDITRFCPLLEASGTGQHIIQQYFP